MVVSCFPENGKNTEVALPLLFGRGTYGFRVPGAILGSFNLDSIPSQDGVFEQDAALFAVLE